MQIGLMKDLVLAIHGLNAVRTAARNSSLSNGLLKKATAPARRAATRSSSDPLPVKIITRVDGEDLRLTSKRLRSHCGVVPSRVAKVAGRGSAKNGNL